MSLKKVANVEVMPWLSTKAYTYVWVNLVDGTKWFATYQEPTEVLRNRMGEIIDSWKKTTKSGKIDDPMKQEKVNGIFWCKL